jgi:hypothetical protein
MKCAWRNHFQTSGKNLKSFQNKGNEFMQSSHSHRIPLIGVPILLLSLLIYVAFNVSYFTRQFSAFFVQPKYSDPNAMPWEETFLIRDESLYGYGLHKRQMYSPEQPKIIKTILYKTKVYQQSHQRGEIVFHINTQGDIEGSWSADFTIGKRHSPQWINYTTLDRTTGRYLPNTFRGNIAPSKIYQDEYGQDKSKLYFITRGQSLLRAHDLRTKDTHRISGGIYVTGWIDPNYNVTGELYLTSMLAGPFQTFYWEAKPSDLAK